MKLYQERCPWCGKIVLSSDSRAERLRFGLTPAHVCPHCQNAFSSAITAVIFLPIIAAIIFSFIGGNQFFTYLFFTVALVFTTICIIVLIFGNIKYYKINSDGKKENAKSRHYTRIVTDPLKHSLNKGDLLLTAKDFDKYDAFTASAPIKILKYSSKNHALTFEFIYDNTETDVIANQKEFYVFLNREIKETITLKLLSNTNTANE